MRIKSPDSVVEAVVLTGDAGATTATTQFLYIVPAGHQVRPRSVKENDALFVARHVKNLQVVWKTSMRLEIQYEEALIDHFRNRWQNIQNLGYIVELRLAPMSSEFSLSSGDRVFP